MSFKIKDFAIMNWYGHPIDPPDPPDFRVELTIKMSKDLSSSEFVAFMDSLYSSVGLEKDQEIINLGLDSEKTRKVLNMFCEDSP
jgi:hypothetical protein